MKPDKPRNFTKNQLFAYQGSYEDFEGGSDCYFAQLAVDHHGSAVRDNLMAELIAMGYKLENESEQEIA